MTHPALASAKLAEWSPMKGGVPLAVLAGRMLALHAAHRAANRDRATSQQELLAARAGAAHRNAGVVASLRGGAPLDPVGSSIYNEVRADSGIPGDTFMFDKESAARAEAAGRALAKSAGLIGALNNLPNVALKGIQAVAKPAVGAVRAVTPKMGLGTKLLGGAAVAGLGYGAYKAGRGALNYMNQPGGVHAQGGHSAHLPQYVNQFGVPEMH